MFNTNNTNPYLSHEYFSQHYTNPLKQTVISQQLQQQQQYLHDDKNIWGGHDRLSELIRKSYQQLQSSSNGHDAKSFNNKVIDMQPLYQGPLYVKKPAYQEPLQSVNHSVYQRNINYNNNYHNHYQQQNNYKNTQQTHDANVANQSNQHQDNKDCYQFVPKQSIPIMFSNYQWNQNEYAIRNGDSHTSQQDTKAIENNHLNRLTPISQLPSIIRSQQPQQRPGFIKQQRRLNKTPKNSQHQEYSVKNSFYNSSQRQSVEINKSSSMIKDTKYLLMRQCDEYRIGSEPKYYNKFGQEYYKNKSPYYYGNSNDSLKQTKQSPSQQLKQTLDMSTTPNLTNNNKAFINNPSTSSYYQIPMPSSTSTSYINKQQHILTTTNPDSSLKQDSFSQQCLQDNGYYSLRAEYEQDLFEFIKKQLIKVTVENKQWIQNEDYYLQQEKLLLQQQTNHQLYALYTQTKQSFTKHKQQQHLTLQSLQQQLTLLNQQLTFCNQHSAKVSTSITVKMHKQQQLYFKHKVNLQNVIIRNNQTLSQLNRLLEDTKIREQQERQSQRKDNNSRKSLRVLMDENQQLKKQLSTEQQLYSKTFRKFITADSAINHLQLKKQQQLDQLHRQLQYAKYLANYTLLTKIK